VVVVVAAEAVTVSVVVEEGEEEIEVEWDSAICSYCNYNFFNYCTTQLIMAVYEINVLELNLYPTTAH
jgi:hypothetical protein